MYSDVAPACQSPRVLPMFHRSYTRSPDATESVVGDRIVLYHRVSRTALVLNPTGSWMWRQLDVPRTFEELVGGLRSRHRTLPAEDAERDVGAFLDDLSRHAMLAVS